MCWRLICAGVFSTILGPAAGAQDSLPKQANAILQKNCLSCHGIAKASGLDLRTREAILKGGTRGPALTTTDAAQSLIIRLISHEQAPAMPPGQKLADSDIDTLRRWIEGGAHFEESASAGAGDEKRREEMAKLEERPITPEERQF